VGLEKELEKELEKRISYKKIFSFSLKNS
jgi:hypothetical protein